MKITKQQFDELKNASDLEQVLKAVGIEVENEQWPQENDEYRFVDHQSDISAAYWDGDKIDQFRLSLGNIHRTERWNRSGRSVAWHRGQESGSA